MAFKFLNKEYGIRYITLKVCSKGFIANKEGVIFQYGLVDCGDIYLLLF